MKKLIIGVLILIAAVLIFIVIKGKQSAYGKAEAKAAMSQKFIEMDSNGDGLVSKEDTYAFFAAAASKDKQMKIYGNLFHEIFNEYCKDEVIDDVLAWINRRI